MARRPGISRLGTSRRASDADSPQNRRPRAKGTALLGVRAVTAESYERIHRPNVVGMGVLPLQYADRDTAGSLGLTGEEEFAIAGVEAINDGTTPLEVWQGHRVPGQTANGHAREAAFFRNGRHPAVFPTKLARLTAPIRSGMSFR
jgi:Aconitase C-terminal domain